MVNVSIRIKLDLDKLDLDNNSNNKKFDNGKGLQVLLPVVLQKGLL